MQHLYLLQFLLPRYYGGTRGVGVTLYHKGKPLPLTSDREKAIAYLLQVELPKQLYDEFGKPFNALARKISKLGNAEFSLSHTNHYDFTQDQINGFIDQLEDAENQLMKGSIEERAEINLTYDINTPDGEQKVRELFYNSKHDEAQAELFEKVFAMAQKLNVEVRHALRDETMIAKRDTKYIGGWYMLDKNSARVKHSGNIKVERKGEILLHELVHSVTSRAMFLKEQGQADLLNPAQVKAIEEIEKIYQKVCENAKALGFDKWIGAENNMGSGDYGLKNSHEFVAELANPVFREKLKQVAMFDDTVKAITEVATGVEKTETAYDRLTAALYQIMDNYEPDFGAKYEQAKYGNIKMNDIFRQPEKEKNMQDIEQRYNENAPKDAMPYDEFVASIDHDKERIEDAHNQFRSLYQGGYGASSHEGTGMFNSFEYTAENGVDSIQVAAPFEWAMENAQHILRDNYELLDGASLNLVHSNLTNDNFDGILDELQFRAKLFQETQQNVAHLFGIENSQVWDLVKIESNAVSPKYHLENNLLPMAEMTKQQAFEYVSVYQQWSKAVDLREVNQEKGLDTSTLDEHIAELRSSLDNKLQAARQQSPVLHDMNGLPEKPVHIDLDTPYIVAFPDDISPDDPNANKPLGELMKQDDSVMWDAEFWGDRVDTGEMTVSKDLITAVIETQRNEVMEEITNCGNIPFTKEHIEALYEREPALAQEMAADYSVAAIRKLAKEVVANAETGLRKQAAEIKQDALVQPESPTPQAESKGAVYQDGVPVAKPTETAVFEELNRQHGNILPFATKQQMAEMVNLKLQADTLVFENSVLYKQWSGFSLYTDESSPNYNPAAVQDWQQWIANRKPMLELNDRLSKLISEVHQQTQELSGSLNEVKHDLMSVPETTKTLSLQEQALADGKRLKQADEKVKKAEWECAKKPNDKERNDNLKAALAERAALHDEIKPRVQAAMDSGKPYITEYTEDGKPFELVVTQSNTLRLALGSYESEPKHNHLLCTINGEVALNAEQRSTPERVSEVLKENFNDKHSDISEKLALINYPAAEKVFSEKEIKDTLNKALKSSYQDDQIAAIKSPVMRGEWLEKIATNAKVPEPIRQAAKNEMAERFGTAEVKQDAFNQPETAKKQTADKGGVSLGVIQQNAVQQAVVAQKVMQSQTTVKSHRMRH